MSGAGRSFVVSLGLTAAVALGGCGSSSSGIPDSKIVSTLNMRKVQGNYAIDGNPFCSVSKLLNDANEVKDASKSRRVIASRDHSIGIEIIRPFAPRCLNDAERRLSKLARGGGHHKHAKGHGKKGKGGGGGG